MLSNKEVFISVHRLRSGVFVRARHRVTGAEVEMSCVGSADGLCNPNDCERDLKEFALEELSLKVSQGYLS